MSLHFGNSLLLPAGDGPAEAENCGDWYVAYTQPKSEALAAENLKRQGFDVYLPLYKTYNKSLVDVVSQSVPMFGRYMFFRPSHVTQSIATARSTRGVSFVLSFGFQMAILKNVQLEAIKVLELARNCLDAGQISPFQPGVKVRFSDNNMRGLDGIVTAVSGQRVKVLLELLGKQHTVSVEHQMIELV